MLLETIPVEDSRDANYPILIKHEYGWPEEERLLAKAESLYKNPDTIEPELLRQWRYITEDVIFSRWRSVGLERDYKSKR